MPVTELPPSRVRLASGNWKPQGAGEEFIRLHIHEPTADPPTFVAPFGTVHIRASAQAVWKSRDDPTRHLSFDQCLVVVGGSAPARPLRSYSYR